MGQLDRNTVTATARNASLLIMLRRMGGNDERVAFRRNMLSLVTEIHDELHYRCLGVKFDFTVCAFSISHLSLPVHVKQVTLGVGFCVGRLDTGLSRHDELLSIR